MIYMKKRAIQLLSVFLSLFPLAGVLLFAGCSGKEIAESTNHSTTPTILTTVNTGTTVPKSETTSSDPTTTLPPTFPIPDVTYPPVSYEPVPGAANLYLMNIEGVDLGMDYFIDDADLWGDKLLLSATAYFYDEAIGETDDWENPEYTIDRQIYLICLQTGKLLGHTAIDSDMDSFGFLEDGTVYSTAFPYHSENRQIILYDESLTPTRSFDASGSPETFCGMEGDGTLWFFDPDEEMLYAYCPFTSEEPKSYALKGYTGAVFCGRSDDLIFLSLSDLQYSTIFGILNLSNGELDIHSDLRGFVPEGDNLFIKEASDKWLMATTDDLDRIKVLPICNENENIYASVGDLFLTSYMTFSVNPEDMEDDTFYYAYSLKRKSDCAEIGCIDSRELYNLNFICLDAQGNAVFYRYNEREGTELLYWEGQKDGTIVPAEGFYEIYLDSASDENADQEQKIYDRFGIHVYYDEISLTGLVSDYTCTPLDSSLLIGEGLDALYLYMSEYPDRFFEEVCVGEYSRLEIYLCGTFIPTDSYGISTAAALTSVKDSAIIMAFNLDYMDQMETNLAHELMHVMEHRLYEYEYTLDLPLLEYWESLNPDDFSYYYSYHDENGEEITNDRYTSWDFTGETEVWFVDPYSTSFPTEDRARIFENLYTETSYLFDSPHMQEKAKYLCALIRAAFPSVGESDTTVWEMFGEVSLEDYRDILEDFRDDLYENAAG